MWECLDQQINCVPEVEDSADCTEDGQLFSDTGGVAGPPIVNEWAVTAGLLVSQTYDSGKAWYQDIMANSCDTTLGPPDAYLGYNEPQVLYCNRKLNFDPNVYEFILYDYCTSMDGGDTFECNANLYPPGFFTDNVLGVILNPTVSYDGCTIYNVGQGVYNPPILTSF